MSETQPPDAMSALRDARQAFDALRQEIARVIVGQDRVVEQMLLAIFCRGHAVVVGVPGLAKTLLISTIAKTLGLGFSRIQFTPDLMPSDITGTEVIQEDRATGQRQLTFVKGPIFSNVILADEINRTPPKTQAALLEAMQERQVTAGGQRHELPEPFFVLATQNPIEQEGTYPLPEAQLDRFMFQISIEYPTMDEELEIVKRATGGERASANCVLSADRIRAVQALVRQVPVADHVIRYALRIIRATRVGEPMEGGLERPALVKDYISWGAGPRASENLILAAKAKAVIDGAAHVTPAHIREVALPVLRHRVLLNFAAEADRVRPEAIIDGLLKAVPVEGGEASDRKRLDALTR